MKITKENLKRIIAEEKSKLLNEAEYFSGNVDDLLAGGGQPTPTSADIAKARNAYDTLERLVQQKEQQTGKQIRTLEAGAPQALKACLFYAFSKKPLPDYVVADKADEFWPAYKGTMEVLKLFSRPREG